MSSASDWLNGNCAYVHSLAIKTDSTLWAWGLNNGGAIGYGTTNNTTYSPVQLGTATNWKMASGSTYHTIALKSDGTLWVSGTNDHGELGDGTYDPSPVLIQVTTAGNDWIQVEAGHVHNLAIKNDGSLWAWGYNIYGQVGDSTTIDKHVPTQIICRRKMTPITLLYFTAQKKKNTAFLEWQTTEEINSKEYQIERSNDAVHYTTIGVIPSKNLSSGSKYNFTDIQPASSRNYYRLRSVDIDARSRYSDIKQLNFGLLTNDIAVYPNPVKNVLYIENNFKAESLSITLSDLAGRELFKTVKQNAALLEIPVTGIRTGIYLITISDGKNRMTKKLIKE